MDMVALKKCTASQQLRKNQQWAGCKPNKSPHRGGRGDFSLDISSHRTTYPELASQICPKMTQNQRDLSHVLYENVTGLTPHRMLSIRISLRTRMKKHGKRGFPIHPSFLPLAPCG